MSATNAVIAYFDSAAVSYAVFDRKSRTLGIQFSNGHTYTYSKVPFYMFNRMLTAKSVGSFVNKNIKGKFYLKS